MAASGCTARRLSCKVWKVSMRRNLCLRPYSTIISPSSSHQHSSASIGSPEPSGYVQLSSRSLISVSGPDASKFLHGLITSSLVLNSTSSFADASGGLYTAFLTAQGKLLFDVFLYPCNASFLSCHSPSKAEMGGYMIEVDDTQRTRLLSHLKRHKLRSKVDFRQVDKEEVSVYATWKGGERWVGYELCGKQRLSNLPQSIEKREVGDRSGHGDQRTLTMVDQRAPGMGTRVLVASQKGNKGIHQLQEFDGLDQVSEDEYRVRRYMRGVPEGQNEMPLDTCLPMNCNMDLMGAIDFKKGCYVGQELTIRTHHTGVVRRRILPVQLYRGSVVPSTLQYNPEWTDALPDYDEDIKVNGKRGKPGKWIAGVGNIGLAMCRLEMMTDMAVSSEPSSYSDQDIFTISHQPSETKVKAFVPDWIRGKIRTPKTQRRVDT